MHPCTITLRGWGEWTHSKVAACWILNEVSSISLQHQQQSLCQRKYLSSIFTCQFVVFLLLLAVDNTKMDFNILLPCVEPRKLVAPRQKWRYIEQGSTRSTRVWRTSSSNKRWSLLRRVRYKVTTFADVCNAGCVSRVESASDQLMLGRKHVAISPWMQHNIALEFLIYCRWRHWREPQLCWPSILIRCLRMVEWMRQSDQPCRTSYNVS